ncbi:MAG TPA: FKBP-type peptidyl-prolyl cis-trans isomerase [Thermoanaerobaculia bacterium]|nr:FKBP-type peptidyl-prolyl cis-trans isomerase [Thermoanaerobaculia bacterium]
MNRNFAPCALLVALVAASPLLGARQGQGQGQQPQKPDGTDAKDSRKEVVTASGLRYTDLKVGEGVEAGLGKTVEVHYTGWLEDGTKFDASQDPGHPFTFRIGIDDVIRGWHEGIAGMKVGGRRRLVIPPELGYGKQGAGRVIPPNATLVFEVDLVNVR